MKNARVAQAAGPWPGTGLGRRPALDVYANHLNKYRFANQEIGLFCDVVGDYATHGVLMKWILFCIICVLPFKVQSQIITTFAGNGTTSGSPGDWGPATDASINAANGGAFDKQGNYYVAEILGHRIRKVRPDGIITSVAGTGSLGYNGDGIPATDARISSPTALAVDASGNIYIDDLGNYRIRKVNAATGLISTVAGTGTSGYNGDNMQATNAQLGGVQDVCVDKFGNIFIADQVNLRIRKVNTAGIITTVAGNGGFSAGGTGDGGPATNATFNFIYGLAMDDIGNIYIADANAAKVRKVDASGSITTVAGNGNFTYAGDGIPATDAQITPMKLSIDRYRNLVIGDKYNGRVFKVDNVGIIHNIAGNGGSGFSGDGGAATAATVDFPAGLVYDTCNNLYIAESTNRRVRKVAFNPTCEPITSVNTVKVNDVNFTVYPNPTSSTITLAFSEKICTISIANNMGQLVYEQQYSSKEQVEINVAHLPPGMYMVRVNGVYVRRFLKE